MRILFALASLLVLCSAADAGQTFPNWFMCHQSGRDAEQHQENHLQTWLDQKDSSPHALHKRP